MQNKTEILTPNTYYHIYNRANGNENIFASYENYRFFLKKYQEYILPIADTFCYCLMPNHFHFLVRIKDEAEIRLALTGFETLSGLASKRFSNLFNAYAQAFNKQEKRKGGLFIRPFKRKKISNTQYLLKLVHYIHFNPVIAGLCKKPNDWNFSSYNALLSKSETSLKREEVINWFNDIENFIYVHQQEPKLSGIENLF